VLEGWKHLAEDHLFLPQKAQNNTEVICENLCNLWQCISS